MSTIDPLATVRVPTAAREKLGLPPAIVKDDPTYGTVYGRTEPPEEVTAPNVDGMLDAIGVPRSKDGALPFTKEWYANAKQRQRNRDKEREKRYRRLDELRIEFATSLEAELHHWCAKTTGYISTEDSQDLEMLLAKTAIERPWDKEEFEALKLEMSAVEERRADLRQGLLDVSLRFATSEKCVKDREAHDRKVEQARADQVAADRARIKAAELAVAQATALLRGEAAPTALEGSDDEAEVVVAAPEGNGYPPQPQGLPVASAGLARRTTRELPPLKDPPQPPLPPSAMEEGAQL
mmetsp:Transcript_6770/g.11901  ORF Transcript_6770/g.11901 Transcript_6770/m.11901 type:complete len:295 (+) Transcript_6770:61-945(+)